MTDNLLYLHKSGNHITAILLCCININIIDIKSIFGLLNVIEFLYKQHKIHLYKN